MDSVHLTVEMLASAMKKAAGVGMEDPTRIVSPEEYAELKRNLKMQKNNSGAAKAPKLENAIADMKRQLRSESKSTLIKQWVSLYAQTVVQQKLIADLNAQIEKLKMPEVVSEQEVNVDIEADASKGVSE